MSRRTLIGRERTAARRFVAALRPYDARVVAKLLGMKTHSIASLLDGRRLPGRAFYDAATRALA